MDKSQDVEKEEKVRRLIDDRHKLSEVMKKNFANDESIERITNSLETPAMKRFVAIHQSDPKVIQAVLALPKSQRREIEKKSSKPKKKDNTPITKIVQMKTTGVLRPFSLTPSLREGEGWEVHQLTPTMHALFNTNDQCKNRHASRLIGKDVHGVVYFYSVDSEGSSANLTIGEFEEFRDASRTLVAQ